MDVAEISEAVSTVPRELVAEKAKRYLAEGRVIVITAGRDHVTAVVRGDGHRYVTGYRDGRWVCTCPNTTDCSHRRALRLIAAPDLPGEPR